MLPYTILSVPDVDTSTLMRTALQKSKECYNCYGLNHYNTLCRHPKERKSSPFRTTSRPTIGNLARADVGVIPLASTGSPTTEAPVLPTHLDHLISQKDIEGLLDVNRLVISHLLQTPAQKVNYIWMCIR